MLSNKKFAAILILLFVYFFYGCSLNYPAQQNSIDFSGNFSVKLSPWTNEKTEVAITNISETAYNWVLLEVVFVDQKGKIINTVEMGIYSVIEPGQTVYYYSSSINPSATQAYVSNIYNNRFIYEPGQGIKSNY